MPRIEGGTSRFRALGVALTALAVLAAFPAVSLAASDPADQPPFGGEEVPPLVKQQGSVPPPGFELNADRVLDMAGASAAIVDLMLRYGGSETELTTTVATRGNDLWEVRYRDGEGKVVGLVVVEDRSGEVDAFIDEQIDAELARGYEGAVGGKASKAWIWLPLSLLFLAPFVNPRRPWRLLHLDLIVLLGLSVSLFFFNKAEIEASVLLVYPVLAYVFARMIGLGFDRWGAGAGEEGRCCHGRAGAGWSRGSPPSRSSTSATRRPRGR